jgi:hypothetical protein
MMKLLGSARIAAAISINAMVMMGCASTHATYAPDGRRGFAVECGGFLSSWSACLVKAGRACGNRGYDTIKGSEEDRNLLVACRLPSTAGAATPSR